MKHVDHRHIFSLILDLLSHGNNYSKIFFIIISSGTGTFTLTESLVKTSLEFLKGYHVLGTIILFYAFPNTRVDR